jgi:hypothetical protein
MKKIILPSLLAAIVVFIWMFISWAVLPWHHTDMITIDDQMLINQMKNSLTQPGIYLYPGEPAEDTDAGMDKWFDQYKAGPLVHFMVYNPQGAEWDMAIPMISSLLINFISAFIAAVLLMMTLAQNPTFMRRTIFVMLLGLFAGFVGPFIEWNWWKYPFNYTIVGVIDLCVTWFLAGMVLAWKIKP